MTIQSIISVAEHLVRWQLRTLHYQRLRLLIVCHIRDSSSTVGMLIHYFRRVLDRGMHRLVLTGSRADQRHKLLDSGHRIILYSRYLHEILAVDNHDTPLESAL